MIPQWKRAPLRFHLLLGLAILVGPLPKAVAEPTQESARSQTSPTRHAPTLLEQIRKLLGLSPSINPAGSRSDHEALVCLISPVLDGTTTQGTGVAVVPTTKPRLIFNSKLNAVQISNDQHPRLYSRTATLEHRIPGVINWPVAALHPGDSTQVRVRKAGASGDAWAIFTLKTASAELIQQTEKMIRQLGENEMGWLEAILNAASTGNTAMASSLLFSPSAPDTAAINTLRQQRIEAGCEGEIPTGTWRQGRK